MGGCCPKGSYSEVDEPSPTTKRRQMAEAAEKRQLENQNRGVKDGEGLRRKQEQREAIERRVEERDRLERSQGGGGGGMRWQVG